MLLNEVRLKELVLVLSLDLRNGVQQAMSGDHIAVMLYDQGVEYLALLTALVTVRLANVWIVLDAHVLLRGCYAGGEVVASR